MTIYRTGSRRAQRAAGAAAPVHRHAVVVPVLDARAGPAVQADRRRIGQVANRGGSPAQQAEHRPGRRAGHPLEVLAPLDVRREALLFSDGGERPPSPCRRSGGVKLRAARPGGRRGGREQPGQSRAGPVLPDGPGAVSEAGRYTRGTGAVTPLKVPPALNPVDSGWSAARTRPLITGRGTPVRVCPAWDGRSR